MRASVIASVAAVALLAALCVAADETAAPPTYASGETRAPIPVERAEEGSAVVRNKRGLLLGLGLLKAKGLALGAGALGLGALGAGALGVGALGAGVIGAKVLHGGFGYGGGYGYGHHHHYYSPAYTEYYPAPAVYSAPVYAAPAVYHAPVYSAPVYSAPVYSAPVYSSPSYGGGYGYSHSSGSSYSHSSGYGSSGW